MRVCLLALTLSAAPASAQDSGSDHCVIEAKKGDRVAKGEDVVVGAGERVGDAVAVEGNVRVLAGATVKSVLVLHGSATIEAGAHVEDSVVAVGGKIKIAPGARVDGSQISLDRSLRIVGEGGKEVNIDVSVGGKDLARELLKPMLAKIHGCGVISAQ